YALSSRSVGTQYLIHSDETLLVYRLPNEEPHQRGVAALTHGDFRLRAGADALEEALEGLQRGVARGVLLDLQRLGRPAGHIGHIALGQVDRPPRPDELPARGRDHRLRCR